MEALQKNNSLTGNDVFWFTELPELQTKLSETTKNFAGSSPITTHKGGMQYQYLHDMLQIFHPSKVTAADLAAKLFKIKQKSHFRHNKCFFIYYLTISHQIGEVSSI